MKSRGGLRQQQATTEKWSFCLATSRRRTSTSHTFLPSSSRQVCCSDTTIRLTTIASEKKVKMVSTRGSTKRAASPDVDVDVTVKVEPRKRGRKAAAQPVDNHVDDAASSAPEPAPKKVKDDTSAFKENAKYENGKTEVADGQYAKATNLIIPVDEMCPLASSFQIYVDNANIIWDANLSECDSIRVPSSIANPVILQTRLTRETTTTSSIAFNCSQTPKATSSTPGQDGVGWASVARAHSWEMDLWALL